MSSRGNYSTSHHHFCHNVKSASTKASLDHSPNRRIQIHDSDASGELKIRALYGLHTREPCASSKQPILAWDSCYCSRPNLGSINCVSRMSVEGADAPPRTPRTIWIALLPSCAAACGVPVGSWPKPTMHTLFYVVPLGVKLGVKAGVKDAARTHPGIHTATHRIRRQTVMDPHRHPPHPPPHRDGSNGAEQASREMRDAGVAGVTFHNSKCPPSDLRGRHANHPMMGGDSVPCGCTLTIRRWLYN